MPTFHVIVTRDVTESAVVMVDAASQEQAQELALDMFFSGSVLDWKKDDALSDPYVTEIAQTRD